MSPKALSPKDAVVVYPAIGALGTLANLRAKKQGPRYYKVGRRVVYKAEDLEAYLFQSPRLTIDSIEPADLAGVQG